MKKLSTLWIFLVITAVLLASCAPSLSVKTLKGTWSTPETFTEAEIVDLLPDFGFDEDEISFAPKSGLALIRNLEFLDSTYRDCYDLTETRNNFISYINSLMEALYNHRTELIDMEDGDDFDDLDDFKGFYAYLYGFDTYDDLLSNFWLTMMALYNGLDGEPIEEGTYKIDGETIDMTPDGLADASYVGVKMVSETEMILDYSNTTVRMTKRS